jgi:hypothetical protein
VAEFLGLKFAHVSIKAIKCLIHGVRVRGIKAQEFDRDYIIPEYLTLGYAESFPLLAVESRVSEVLRQRDAVVYKFENRLKALFAVNDCVFCLVISPRDLMQEDGRAWIALENRVEEKPSVLRRPNTSPLVWRI